MTEGQFFKASGLEEACGLLAKYGGTARLLAGGTDLMVAVNKRQLRPELIVFIGESGLNYIREEGGNVVIGAATTFTEIARSNLVREKVPLLAEAVLHIASPAIRNVATLGGNLANASPAADSATALLALGANLKITSQDGERNVAAEDFFAGPGQTVLQPTEIIREVLFPEQAKEAGWAYRKIGKRKAQSLSIVSVAIYCPLNDGKCQDPRIALGAVAPTPILATQASSILEGKPLRENVILEASKAAADATNPIDDVRGSAWYRRRATEAVVRQLLTKIAT